VRWSNVSLVLLNAVSAKHELTQPTMVWDESFESWRVMRINSMPTFILLSAQGEMLLRVAGRFPEEQLQALI